MKRISPWPPIQGGRQVSSPQFQPGRKPFARQAKDAVRTQIEKENLLKSLCKFYFLDRFAISDDDQALSYIQKKMSILYPALNYVLWFSLSSTMSKGTTYSFWKTCYTFLYKEICKLIPKLILYDHGHLVSHYRRWSCTSNFQCP